jgi:hypothetical protein
MTILAGVFSRESGAGLPDAVCESLCTHVSRNPNDDRIEFRDHRTYLVKVDIGAFGRPGHHLSATGSYEFPNSILRKHFLQLMRRLWALNVRDYGYAFDKVLTYYRYWTMAEGKI